MACLAPLTPDESNAQCKVFGRGDIGKGYTARDPGQNGIQNPDITGSGGVFKQTYACKEPLYMPCGPSESSPAGSSNATVAAASEHQRRRRRRNRLH